MKNKGKKIVIVPIIILILALMVPLISIFAEPSEAEDLSVYDDIDYGVPVEEILRQLDERNIPYSIEKVDDIILPTLSVEKIVSQYQP